MTRAELIQTLVLNECCDDYEDIEHITKWMYQLGPKCGLTIAHEDIIQALRESIKKGWLKAWDLRRWPDPATTEYEREEITPLNPRFARTEEGLAFQKASSASGPFDEEHNLRESWLTPEMSLRRGELIRLLILDSYPESCTHVLLATIERHWNPLAERHGISISRDEVIQALRELIVLGYVNADYRDEGRKYDGMPPLEDIKPFGAYFWITGEGWDFLQTKDSWWPFDYDDDVGDFILRKDWVPPNA
jgi:hypothetical protein